MPEVFIKSLFCGPPGYGNGGYVAGMLAKHLQGTVAVMLRQPTPLETAFTITVDGAERLTMYHGATLIAEATLTDFDLAVPAPPAYADAAAAAGTHPGLSGHPAPGCYVCGPQHPDGLRIHPGWLPGRDCVAAAWTPHADMADPAGNVAHEFIWAVLDCPGGFALQRDRFLPVLLGRFAVRILAPVPAGEPHILMGWLIANEGRKYFTGTALFSTAGALRACASGTWIKLKEALNRSLLDFSEPAK